MIIRHNIQEFEYEYNTEIKNLTFSDNVDIIGKNGFAFCRNLQNVIISSNIKTIGECAFLRCYNLIDIEILPGVKNIELGAFAFCKRMRNINIPHTVETIGDFILEGCILDNLYIPAKFINDIELILKKCKYKNIILTNDQY